MRNRRSRKWPVSIVSVLMIVFLLTQITWSLDAHVDEKIDVEQDKTNGLSQVVQTGLERSTPVSFVENMGQLPDEIRFRAESSTCTISVFDDGFSIGLVDPGLGATQAAVHDEINWNRASGERPTDSSIYSHQSGTVRLRFINSGGDGPRGCDPCPYYSNYFIGGEANWTSHVRSYRAVVIQDLYPGIDIAFDIHDGALKYELIVQPRVDASIVQIEIGGVFDDVEVTDDEIVIETHLGTIYDTGLTTFYKDVPRSRIPSRFQIDDQGYICYSLGTYDADRPIVIDPVVVSSLVGGSNNDWSSDVVVGDDGVIYVASSSSSLDFLGGTAGRTIGVTGGPYDVVITAIEPDGRSLSWITYIGGTGPDYVTSMRFDINGNFIVCGDTGSSDFPTTTNGYDRTLDGDDDTFVLLLSSTGDSLISSTLMGGGSSERSSGLAVDEDGSIIIAGSTNSTDYPTSAVSSQSDYSGGFWDGYCSIFSSDLSTLLGSTYLGAEGEDLTNDVGVGENGDVVLTGSTNSLDFPTSDGSNQTENNGLVDSYVCILSEDLQSMISSTLLGGSRSDYSEALVVLNDSILIAGRTRSADFPVTPGAMKVRKDVDNYDLFITWISRDLSNIITSTYMGGRNDDWVYDLEMNSGGLIYLTGSTSSLNYPTTDGAFASSYQGGPMDAFVSVLTQNLSHIPYSSYLGGSLDSDVGIAIELDNRSGVYIVGKTLSDDFPTSRGAIHTNRSGEGWDGFITKLLIDFNAPIAHAGPDMTIDQYHSFVFNGTGSTDNAGIVDWTWSFTDSGGEVTLDGPMPRYTFDNAGIFTVTLIVKDLTGHSDEDKVVITVIDTTPPTAVGGPDITIGQHEDANFDGSESHDNVGIAEWTWTFKIGNEDISLSGPTVSYRFDLAGIVEVNLTVMDAVGNFGYDIIMVWVLDTTPPIAVAGPNISIDQGQTAYLDASGSQDNTGIEEWAWAILTGAEELLLSGERVSVVLNDAGVFLAELEVRDGYGNVGEDSLYIHVRDTEPPTANAGRNATYPQSSIVILDGTNSSDNVEIVRFHWNLSIDGEPTYLEGVHQSLTIDIPGQYRVTLSVTDAEGNVGIDIVTISILDTMAPIARIITEEKISAGATAVLDGSESEDNVGIDQWTWSFQYDGKSIELLGATTKYRFEKEGTYEITLTCTDGAGNRGESTILLEVSPVDGGIRDPIVSYLLIIIIAAVIIICVVAIKRSNRG